MLYDRGLYDWHMHEWSHEDRMAMMRHTDPHIQELIEQMQGALRILAPSGVLWQVREEMSAYRVHCTLCNSVPLNSKDREARVAPKIYILEFTVSRMALLDCVRLGSKYWDSFKWSIIRQCIWKLIEDSKPAEEKDVEYMAEVEPWKLEL